MKNMRGASIFGALVLGVAVVNALSVGEVGRVPNVSVTTSGTAATSTTSETSVGVASSKTKRESPEQDDLDVDVVTTVEELKCAVAKGDVDGVARILNTSDDINALAEGFRFDASERDEVLEKSDDRNEDPDVVAIKGIAQSALRGGDVEKLAAVMVVSTFHKGRAKNSVPELESQLENILSDGTEMLAVVKANANEEDPSEAVVCEEKGGPSEAPSNGRRLAKVFDLLVNEGRGLKCDGCTPANSLVCAHCWPRNVCTVVAWCP